MCEVRCGTRVMGELRCRAYASCVWSSLSGDESGCSSSTTPKSESNTRERLRVEVAVVGPVNAVLLAGSLVG